MRSSFAWRYYLDRLGEDHGRADSVGFEGSGNMARALTERGYPIEARQFRILCAAHLVQWAYVRRGMGVGLMMDEIALADPEIARAASGFSVPVPMWLVAHREVRTSRSVRVVFDMLAEALSRPPRPVAGGPVCWGKRDGAACQDLDLSNGMETGPLSGVMLWTGSAPVATLFFRQGRIP